MQYRQARVADAIREVVARVVVEELGDPDIGFVTITRCSLTRDLKIATVFFSVLGDEARRRRTLAGLERAAGFVRRRLAQALELRRTPELRFRFDELQEHEYRVGELLSDVTPAPPPVTEMEPPDKEQDPD
ncbi:MAG: 30S ribosome-binding factor RbfA [bacterium]